MELGKEKKKKKSKHEDIALLQKQEKFSVEPSEKKGKLNSANWPLLLKVSTISIFWLHILRLICFSILTD